MPWKKDAKGNWVKGDAPVGAATLAKPKVNAPTPPTAKLNSTTTTIAKISAPTQTRVLKASTRTTVITEEVPKITKPPSPKIAPPAPVPKISVSKETTSTLSSTPIHPELKSLTSKVPSPQKASKPKVKSPKLDTLPAPEPALKPPEEVKPKVSEEPKVVQPKVVEEPLAAKEFASPLVVHDEIEPKGNIPKLPLSPEATTAKPVAERLFAPQSPSTRALDPPPSLRPDPFDDISFDGTYLTSGTTEEVYNARTGMIERKTVSRSGRSNEHHYYSHLAGNPAAYKEEDEDDRSMSSMFMLFRNARGGRYTDPAESTNYANYQMDDDVTIDSFSSIFGLMKYPSKAAPKTNTLSDMENDDVLAGIIGDVSNLHDTDIFDDLDSIEPDHDVSPTANCSLSDFSDLHDLEEQLERNPKKLDEMSMEAKSTSSGSKTDDVYSLDSTSTSSSLRSKNKRGRKNKIMCIIIFAFVVLSVISVIVFAEVNKKRERINGTHDNKRDSPMQAPLPPGQTYQPTITVSPTKSPTRFTSQKPTNGSTVNFIDPIMNFLQENQIFFDRDPLSPDFMAVQWLADEAQIRIGDDEMSSVFGNGLEFSSKLIQRFALLTLDFALMRPDTTNTGHSRSNTIAVKYQDECQWTGVHCAEVGPLAGEVLQIDFSHAGLTGTIPNDVKLFKNLKKLHLAGNNIMGTIPTALFEIKSLQHLYLYQNRLTGTIPNNIGNMWNM